MPLPTLRGKVGMGGNCFDLFSLGFAKWLFSPTLALPLLGEGIRNSVAMKYVILVYCPNLTRGSANLYNISVAKFTNT